MNWLSRILLGAFAALKFGKVFLSAGSMLLAIGVYGLMFGWRYAIGVVLLMFVHEMGHFIAGRQRGLEMGLPTFIPFVGAWTGIGSRIPDAETQAYMGMGGPVLGTIGTLVCWYVAENYQIDWLLALSYTGFFLNLINLAPILPFDGGHVMAALSPRLWLLGVPVLVWLFFRSHSPVMLIVAILAVPYVLAALRWKSDSPEAKSYYAVPLRTRWAYGAYYLLLVVFLAMMVTKTDEALKERVGDRPSTHGTSGEV